MAVTVYGITAQKGAPAGSPNVISQLSPIYNPIAIGKPSFTMFPGLATTNEQANRSRVYYLQGDLAAPKIVEYSLTNNDAGNLSVLPQTFPHPNTSIAACNRAQSRLIAYQALESNNSLFSYDTDQEASTRIQNTDGLPPGTPLAMVAVLENIYLYYGSSGRYLTKVALTKDGWQKPFQVPGSIHLAQGTCLSVTNSGTINYVVYQQDGGDGFNIVEDTLDTREP
ncbi:hypothetical protein FGG08_004952 [Glutinoglossum americanum]|uniref:Fucose-specific lectin n=1 Tax=Glutinoglossum americanum TaxID=1670608 RepID=A0A9P8L3D7_9PEZI|nr:hypothetical protein FGG08_004952 [Glutinoglossum americanum]